MLGLATALIFAQAATAPTAPSPPRAPCADTAHAAFDFWLGEWDVYPNGSDKLVAHSKIEKLYGGCAVRENWMPLQGNGGGSLNSIDPATGRWHQEWIGSAPGRIDFDGGLVGREMVLTGYSSYAGGGPGKPGLVRIVYTPNADGSVRQHGLASLDEGLTWRDSYDFIYRPHKAAG
jgi:hypothetical protein